VLDEHPPEALRERVMQAVRTCPKNAISIED
jgi:ferredoxin